MEVELFIVIETEEDALYNSIKAIIKSTIELIDETVKIKYTKKTDKPIQNILKHITFITTADLNLKHINSGLYIPLIIKDETITYDEDNEKYKCENAIFKELTNPIILDDAFKVLLKIKHDMRDNSDEMTTDEDYKLLASHLKIKRSELMNNLEDKKFMKSLFKKYGIFKFTEIIEDEFSQKHQKQIMKNYVIKTFESLDINSIRKCSEYLSQVDELSYFKDSFKVEIFGEIEKHVMSKTSEMSVDTLKKWRELALERKFGDLASKIQNDINTITIKDREKILKQIQNTVNLSTLIKFIADSEDKEIAFLAIIELKDVYNEAKNTSAEWIKFIDEMSQYKIDKELKIKLICKIIKVRIDLAQRISGKLDEKNIYFFCLHNFLIINANHHFELQKLLILITKYLSIIRIDNFIETIDKLNEETYKNLLALEFKFLSL